MTDDGIPEEPSATPAPPATTARGRRDVWWLIAVLTSSGAAALLAHKPSASLDRPAAVASPVVAQGTPGLDIEAADEATTVISGKVMERVDVPKYTYLRLETTPGAASVWVAVSSADVKLGHAVRVVDAQLMTAFVSATLKRTFDQIYFGALADGSTGSASGTELAKLAAGGNPHAANGSSAESAIVVRDVTKAEGPSGRTVAETYAQRRALTAQKVRVRGVVVKVISGVLERSFVHIRDGSENAQIRDLVVTTRADPVVGDRVLFEGTVTTDKDFGAGYIYPVLLEDADIVAESMR